MTARDLAAVRAVRQEVRKAEMALQARLQQPRAPGSWAVLGSMPEGDVEALAFLVLMQASKSAREDLKAIMDGVKAVNDRKARLRDLMFAKRARKPAGLDPDSFVMALLTLQVNELVAEVEADRDAISELSEMGQVRLQMAMDRLSKMMSTLSNMMKKMADTQSAIIGNMK